MSRVALVTGAAGGLGRAVTRQLADAGWQLALVSRDLERLQDRPAGALWIGADCSTPAGAAKAFGSCCEHFGRPPDALAHCAGSVLLAPLHRTSPEQYLEVVRANLDSAFFTLGAFVKGCLEAKQPGAAVLVSSVVARIGVLNHEAIAAARLNVATSAHSAALVPGGPQPEGERRCGWLPQGHSRRLRNVSGPTRSIRPPSPSAIRRPVPESAKVSLRAEIVAWWVTSTSRFPSRGWAKRNSCGAATRPSRSPGRSKNEFNAGSSITGPRSSSAAVSRQRHHWLE
jgi:short chain dehydrogenase